MPLGTATDLQNRIGGAAALVRLFDRDRDGTADPAVLAAAMAYADALIYSKLGASQPGVRFDVPGPVPVLILDLWCRLAIGYAGEAFPGSGDPRNPGPYAGMKASALKDLDALADNNRMQLPSGTPAPYSGALADVCAPTPVWSDAARPWCDERDRGMGNGSGGRSGF